jgi:hypothetical protein
MLSDGVTVILGLPMISWVIRTFEKPLPTDKFNAFLPSLLLIFYGSEQLREDSGRSKLTRDDTPLTPYTTL